MGLEIGDSVPVLDQDYEDNEGNAHNLTKAVANGALVLGIYKSSCVASKAMMPLLGRIEEHYADNGVTVLGVAQDSPNVTKSFKRRTGTDYPIIIEGDDYPISVAYDIFATPTVFVIDSDGKIVYTTMGFMRNQVNDIGNAAAKAVGAEPVPLVGEDEEDIPPFVPG